MGKVKGCMNEACFAHQKKIRYKEEDEYCSKCGMKLYYVCKECYKQLPDGSEKHCVRCLAEKQERKDHRTKIVKGVAVGAGSVIVVAGKQAIKAIPKFK